MHHRRPPQNSPTTTDAPPHDLLSSLSSISHTVISSHPHRRATPNPPGPPLPPPTGNPKQDPTTTDAPPRSLLSHSDLFGPYELLNFTLLGPYSFDAKRLIGRRFNDASVQSDIKLWPFKVIASPGDKPMIAVNYKGEEK